jgi:hypothetical protein
MNRIKLYGTLSLILISCFALETRAEPYNGYTLFGPNNSNHTYLVDMNNNTVHSWTHSRNGGYSAYLLETGHVIRTANTNNQVFGGGGSTGVVQKYDWDGSLVWEFTYSNNDHMSHHDIEPMPNGNVLLIAWEYRSASQAQQAGYNRYRTLWPEHIVEVEPDGQSGGNIVWEWHAWDHLIQDYDPSKDNYGVVGDHPELIDINTPGGGGGPGGGDWMHANGISYNPELDQIVFSSHFFDEVYVIDHSTTTEEAAGHSGGNSGMGGDILYRWGNPGNYDAPGSAYFHVVHCSIWILEGLPGAGNIMAFNNGEGQGVSVVAEIVPPRDSLGHYHIGQDSAFGPSEPVWTYSAPGFYSNHLGGCQRLPNGNTIAVESTSGNMFEVDESGEIQWSYYRGGEIVRALRYGDDYPGLWPADNADYQETLPEQIMLLHNYPNPFNASTTISFHLDNAAMVSLDIYNVLGEHVKTLNTGLTLAGECQVVWHGDDQTGNPVNSGVYFSVLKTENRLFSRKMVLLK